MADVADEGTVSTQPLQALPVAPAEALNYRTPRPPPLRPWWMVVAGTLMFVGLAIAGFAVVTNLLLAYQHAGAVILSLYAGVVIVGLTLLEYAVLREFHSGYATSIGLLITPLVLLLWTSIAFNARSLVSRAIQSADPSHIVPLIVWSGVAIALTFVAIAHFAFARRVRRFARLML